MLMISDMISKIPAEYIPQISDFIKIILPIIATYLVTRYSLNSPKRTEVMQKQFDLIYLPLYKLVKQLKLNNKSDKQQVVNFSRHLVKVLQKNYEFAFPQLHELSQNLIKNLDSDGNYMEILSNIIYQIEFDYERLKRNLGYPSKNIIQITKRLKRRDKWGLFVSILMMIDLVFFTNGILLILTRQDFKMFVYSALMFAVTWVVYKEI